VEPPSGPDIDPASCGDAAARAGASGGGPPGTV